MAEENNHVNGNHRLKLKQVALLLAILLFASLFAFDVITASEAAALTTPVLAALVAFSLYETVHDKRLQEDERQRTERTKEAERRHHEREKDRLTAARHKRSDAYIRIIEHGVQSFTKTGFTNTEASIRVQIALWGSQEFIDAYLLWRQAIAPYTGQGAVPIAPQDQARIQEALASLVSAARVDVDIDSEQHAKIQSLATVLFDDYTPNAQMRPALPPDATPGQPA